jgi:putative ABC transport system permease protein
MTRIPRWRRYLRLTKPDVIADVDDELSFHIEMRVTDNIRRGMSPDDARREALQRFGTVDNVRDALVEHDRTRQTRIERREFLGDLSQDIAFGFRSLRRAPAFAAASILTLALGIGANTAIFSVVHALLLRPLPYRQPQELVSIGAGSGGEFFALRDRLRTFREIAAYRPQQYALDNGGAVTRMHGAAVTPNLFKTLGVTPMMGSGFTDEQGVPGKNLVVILSYRLWQREFGASPDVVGKRVLLEAVPFTVVGVMPSDFRYPSYTSQFWVPLTFNPQNAGAHWAVQNIAFLGRVKSGLSADAAIADLRSTWPTMRRLNPLWDPGESYGRDVPATPLQERMIGAPKPLLWLLLGCVSLVLLIACVNVANLLLARATVRERELAVRAAVGGGRARLIRQLITESVLLSFVGATLGVGIAVMAVRWLVSMMPTGIPRLEEIAVNGTVLLVTAGVAIVTGLLFGIVPAVRATGGSAAAAGSMIGGRRSTSGTRHHRIAGLLVSAEVALAVTLVIGAQLLVRSFVALGKVETGYDASHLIAARISPPGGSYNNDNAGRVDALYKAVLDRFGATPGVRYVAAVDKMPIASQVWGIAPRIAGQWEDATKILPDVHHFQAVTANYFAAMGIPITAGRAIEANDGPDANPVAVVSESMARKFWPNESAIGKRIGYPWPSPWITIVGVVPDVRQDSLRDTLNTSIYVPWQQRSRMSSTEMWLIARTTGDPAAMAGTIRSIVSDIDRTVAVSDVRTMDEIIGRSVQRDRFMLIMIGLFALVALMLGAIGIYGVMSYLVTQRTQEMGVRIALGASAGSVIGLVVRRAAVMAGVGSIVGVIAAVWATKPLASFLYGISATDPLTFASVPILLLLVALAASYLPARRATKIDPLSTLRGD